MERVDRDSVEPYLTALQSVVQNRRRHLPQRRMKRRRPYAVPTNMLIKGHSDWVADAEELLWPHSNTLSERKLSESTLR